MVRFNDASNSNFLTRRTYQSNLTEGQILQDATLKNFTHQATDPTNLIAMTAGSFAFRFGKLAFLEGAATSGISRFAPKLFINGAASTFALGVEVTAFRGTSNLLNGTPLSETFEANGWKSSAMDFALLKGIGHLGGNPVLSNVAQSSAMVMGRDISAHFGWMEKDHRSYVERLAEAQATTFALSAGQALAGTLTGGRFQIAERALETRLSTLEAQGRESSGMFSHPLGARNIELLSMSSQERGENKVNGADSIRPGIGRTGRMWRGLADRVLGLVPNFDINYRINPNRKVDPVPTREAAEPIRSVQEGINRTRIAGHDKETLSFLRWGAAQLRHQPEVRQAFLQDMRQLFNVQQRLRTLWEPIVANLPRPNLENLNQRARNYLNRLAELAPEGNHYYAEHLVLRARLAELKLTTREDFSKITETQLREMGIEPESIHSIGRNAHAFSAREIDARLDHEALRNAPETVILREAYDRFQSELDQFNVELQAAEVSMAELRSKISTTSDVERRSELEKEIKGIAAPFNKRYWEMTGRVNEAMRTFLSDPVNARIFLIQNAYHTSLKTAVLGMSPRQMAAHLKAQEAQLSGSQAELAKTIRGAAEGLELVGERGFVARSFYAALRFFNKDSLSPQVLRRRYEVALTRMVEEASPAFWNLPKTEDAALKEAVEAQTSYFQEYYKIVNESREGLASLELENQNFWKFFDQEMRPLILRDLQRQVEQANAYMSLLSQKIGNDFYDRGTSRNESYAEEHQRLNTKAAEAIEALRIANADTKINSRDLNRKREAALQRVQDLFKFANKIRKRENNIIRLAKTLGARFRNGNHDPLSTPLVPVSSLAMPYVTKFQAKMYHSLTESLRVGLPLVWQTLPRVIRLINAVKREHSFSTLQHVFASWASGMARSRGDTFVVDQHTDAITELSTAQFAGKHAGWPDFAAGPTPGAGIAQRGAQGSSVDTPLILAKDGLGKLMGPLFNRAIDMLTEGVGDSSKQFDKSVSRAARALVTGDAENASLRPSNTAAYDELTMTVINLMSPYRFSPFEGTSEIISLPQGGRSFRISDRAMALSSRPQNLLLTLSLNSYTMYPKPDRPLPLRKTRMTTVTEWHPTQALGWGMEANPVSGARYSNGNGTNGNGHESNGPVSLIPHGPEPVAANWLRTHWYNMATVPEYRTVTPSVRRIFAPFEKPIDASVEQTLEQMFGGMDGVYPNAAVARDLRQKAETSQNAESLRASQRYDLQLIETYLDRASLELQNLDNARSLRNETSELADMIERRKAHLFKLSWKMERGRPLNEMEQREWNALRESAAHHEQSTKVWQTLELSKAFQREISDLAPKALVKILNQRIQQLQLALARATVGEALSPAEQLLLQEVETAFTSPGDVHADRVIAALRNPDLSLEEAKRLEAEENIREHTRRLARALPGGGRGSIDVVEESANDQARIVSDAAGEVQRGPRSLARTYHQASRFVAHCMQLGFGEAMVDLLTNNKWNLYTAHAAWIGRRIMEPMQWRPEVDAATLRTIEEVRIKAKTENRPIVIAATHESWTDITSIMSLLPEARFNAKFELVFTGVLLPPLIGGRHNLITRGNPEKSRRQMERAGRRMLDYGVATATFHGGTRTKAGVSPAKKGTAHLALDTNALVLNLSMNGPQQVMPLSWGELLTKGGGTHRRVFFRASVLDSKDYAGDNKKEEVARFTQDIQNKLMAQELVIFQELHRMASQGDIMARAQLTQNMSKLRAGMDLIHQGDIEGARRWAEGDGKKSQGMKTDFEFLRQVTAWWDSVRSVPPSSPQ